MLKPLSGIQRAVLGVLVGVILLSAGWVAYRQAQPPPAAPALPASAPHQDASTLTVDVSGAVKNPGVYDLPSDARAEAALEAAGGFTSDADRTSVNLAKHLKDGLKLVVRFVRPPAVPRGAHAAARPLPTSADANPPATAPAQTRRSHGAAPLPATPLSLNSATLEQLDQLPGVGPARAQAIVAYREQHPFQTVEELSLIPGLTPGRVAQLRPYVVP